MVRICRTLLGSARNSRSRGWRTLARPGGAHVRSGCGGSWRRRWTARGRPAQMVRSGARPRRRLCRDEAGAWVEPVLLGRRDLTQVVVAAGGDEARIGGIRLCLAEPGFPCSRAARCPRARSGHPPGLRGSCCQGLVDRRQQPSQLLPAGRLQCRATGVPGAAAARPGRCGAVSPRLAWRGLGSVASSSISFCGPSATRGASGCRSPGGAMSTRRCGTTPTSDNRVNSAMSA